GGRPPIPVRRKTTIDFPYEVNVKKSANAWRLQTRPNPHRDSTDQVPPSIPIYFRCKHTANFAFRFILHVTYTPLDSSLGSSFSSIYKRSIKLERSDMQDFKKLRFEDWDTPDKDVEQEIKEGELLLIPNDALKLPSMPAAVDPEKDVKMKETSAE
ncbi:hypothetical protein BT69DRAFT_1139237, partial [Atractiella rhizophila]